MQAPMEELRNFVDKNRQEMLSLWETLVNMQGYSREFEKIEQVLDFLYKNLSLRALLVTISTARAACLCWWQS